nr:ankyrin repeat domain-containing protein [Pseudomonadota bacterium]
DKCGHTAMHFASKAGAIDTMKLLNTLGLHYDEYDHLGRRPIHYAATASSADALEFLAHTTGLPRYNLADNNGKYTIHYAAEYGRIKTIYFLFLLEQRDLHLRDKEGKSILDYAVEGGQISTFDWLMKQTHFDLYAVDNEKRNCLHHAARANQTAMVEHLLTHYKMDTKRPDRMGLFAVHHAVIKSAKETMQALVARGDSYQERSEGVGMTPIHIACKLGLKAMFLFLAGKGVNTKVQNNRGQSGGFYAAASADVEMLQFLSEQGMPLTDVCDGKKDTPLHFAVISSSLSKVKFLLRIGADINARNKKGLTPGDVALARKNDALANRQEEKSIAYASICTHFARLRGEKHVIFKSSLSIETVKTIEKRPPNNSDNNDRERKQPKV